MAFTNVALTGTVNLEPGKPAPAAVVAMTLSNEISDGSKIIEPFTTSVRTLHDGTFSITVPANDDSTTTPQNTYYTVSITFGVTVIDTWAVIVPHADAPTVDLFSLARIGVGNLPVPTYGVQSIEGLNGNVVFGSPDGSIAVGTSGASVTLEATDIGVVRGVSAGYAASVGGTSASPIVGVQYGVFDLFGSASVAQDNAESYAFTVTNAASVATEVFALAAAMAASTNAVTVSSAYTNAHTVNALNGLQGSVSVVSPDGSVGVSLSGASVQLSVAGGSVKAITPGYAASVGGTAASPLVGVQYGTFDLFGSAATASIGAISAASVTTSAASTAAIATATSYTNAHTVNALNGLQGSVSVVSPDGTIVVTPAGALAR